MAARKSSARSRKPAASSRTRRPVQKQVAKTAARPAAKARAPRRSARGKAPAAMAMNAPNGKPPVNGIGLTHHHLDFTSHDVEGIRHFYADLLGFKNFLYIPEHKYLTIMI